MRAFRLFLILGLAAATAPPLAASAGVPEAVALSIDGFDRFAAASDTLAAQSRDKCDTASLRPAFDAAWDAWQGVAHLRFGPIETDGRGLAIAYWPDPKGIGARVQGELLAADPASLTPERLAATSVAARGFPALERLLFPAEALPSDPCPLIRATAADLARTAAVLAADWRDSFGPALLSAGAAGNTDFLSGDEAKQALFTQLAGGLDRLIMHQLGRPLGTFDAPHPDRAEARASARSQRNIALAIASLADLAAALAPDQPLTAAAFARAESLAVALDDPDFSGAGDPQGRLKIEILQQALQAARDAAVTEIGAALGVELGFNAGDGD